MKLLTPRRRLAPATEMSDRDQRLIWRITALLLDYPTTQTFAIVDELRSAAEQLPISVRTTVLDFLGISKPRI